MSMSMYKIRIIANACITRFTRGERIMNEIIDSYNPTEENRTLIVAEIISKKSDISFDED